MDRIAHTKYLLLLTIFLAGSWHDALPRVKQGQYAVVSTLDYPFMDRIAEIIKGTDLDSVLNNGGNKVRITDKSMYSMTVRPLKDEQGQYTDQSHGIDFRINGSYKITVYLCMLMLLDEHGNIFSVDGLRFFSYESLNPYFTKSSVHRMNHESFFYYPEGIRWYFIVHKGQVTHAFVQYAMGEDFWGRDLFNNKVIPYHDLYVLFYK